MHNGSPGQNPTRHGKQSHQGAKPRMKSTLKKGSPTIIATTKAYRVHISMPRSSVYTSYRYGMHTMVDPRETRHGVNKVIKAQNRHMKPTLKKGPRLTIIAPTKAYRVHISMPRFTFSLHILDTRDAQW